MGQCKRRLDAVSLAAAHWRVDALALLHTRFPMLHLAESSCPLGSLSYCRLASIAHEGDRQAAYAAASGQLEETVRYLLTWLQQQQAAADVVAACVNQPGSNGTAALQHLLMHFNPQ